MKKYTWSFSYIAPDEDTARESFEFDLYGNNDAKLSETIPKEKELTPKELKIENEDENKMYTGN